MNARAIMGLLVSVSILVIIIIFGYSLANQGSSNPKPIESLSSFYLGDSRIFVVSANATYGKYPFPTVTNPPSWSSGGSPIAQEGESCVIINVTLRNDYSTQNPFPRQPPFNKTYVYVALTAYLYSGDSKVNATDITNAFPLASVFTNRAFTSLDYGESQTINIYLATKSKDITSFQISPYYIEQYPPP